MNHKDITMENIILKNSCLQATSLFWVIIEFIPKQHKRQNFMILSMSPTYVCDLSCRAF